MRKTVQIAALIKHHIFWNSRFDSKNLKNDIALVKLQRPVTFRRGLRPACLPDKYRGFPLDSLSDKPTIIGWGSTATGRPTVTHLR